MPVLPAAKGDRESTEPGQEAVRRHKELCLLLEQMEDEVFEELCATIITASQDVNNFARKVFTIVKKDADLFKVLFSENGDKRFLKRIVEVPRARTLFDWHQLYPQATEHQLDVFCTFIVNGAIGVIEQWVRTGCKKKYRSTSDP